MKATAVMPPKFTGEYWDYTIEQTDAGELVNTYFKDSDIRFQLVSGDGNAVVFYKEPLRNNAQLRNVRDRNGRPIFEIEGVPYSMFLGTPQPVFSVFGTVQGYKHVLMRNYAIV